MAYLFGNTLIDKESKYSYEPLWEGAPVATNKERRPSEARERRGRETVSAPGNREQSERNQGKRKVSPIEHRLIHIRGDYEKEEE